MVSQTVLLRGVNDDVETLAALMRAFVETRVKPYYLHHPDLAPGTSHFRLTIEEGQALVAALRGRVSGLCQPTYVLDIPGGYGKAPIGPQTVRILDNGRHAVSDYQRRRTRLPAARLSASDQKCPHPLELHPTLPVRQQRIGRCGKPPSPTWCRFHGSRLRAAGRGDAMPTGNAR